MLYQLSYAHHSLISNSLGYLPFRVKVGQWVNNRRMLLLVVIDE